MEIIDIINQSSILFIAVIGAFVIFRMQWLRREIDDYRGRIIDLIFHDAGEFPLEMDKNRKIFYDCEFDKLEKKVKMKIKDFNKNKTYYYGLNDNKFNFVIEETNKIKDDTGKMRMCDLTYHVVNLGETYNLFLKRYKHKKWVLRYLLVSLVCLIGSFLITYLSRSGIDLPIIANNIYCKLIYAVLVVIDFVLLYVLIRNDN